MRHFVLATLLLLALAVAGTARWGPVGCGPVGPVAFAQPAESYRWYQPKGHEGYSYLFCGKKQLGMFVHATATYKPLLDYEREVWGEACEPPIPPPIFGVVASKVGDGPSYAISGDPVTRAEAVKAAKEGLPDDKDKLRVSVFAGKEKGKRIVEELRAELGEDGKDFILRTYAPDSWVGKPAGFKTDGDPTIYTQAPSGQVLHRQDDYSGGAVAAVQALRKAKKDYDPKKDADQRKGGLSIDGGLLGKLAIAAALGVLGVLAVRFIQERRALA